MNPPTPHPGSNPDRHAGRSRFLAGILSLINVLIVFSAALAAYDGGRYFANKHTVHPPQIDGTPEVYPTKVDPPQIIGTPVPSGGEESVELIAPPSANRITWFETRPTQGPDAAAPLPANVERDAEVLPTQTPEAPAPGPVLATAEPGGIIPTTTVEADLP